MFLALVAFSIFFTVTLFVSVPAMTKYAETQLFAVAPSSAETTTTTTLPLSTDGLLLSNYTAFVYQLLAEKMKK